MTTLSVSVGIVSWNHRAWLAPCLDALLEQDYPHLDVTVVDNGSHDGSPAWIADTYADRVKLWPFVENRGFCQAFNWAMKQTHGELILSLNPDVVVRPGFVAEMVRAMDDDERIGIVAPKLLMTRDPAYLDSTGLFIDRRRRPYDRGQGERDRGQYDRSPDGNGAGGLPVFGACGGAALYRRTMLLDVSPDGEYFDQSFFAYYEDADLSWRARLREWQCVYAPRAVATHDRGGGDRLRKQGRAAKDAQGPRLALRNRYLMTLKNDSPGHFARDLPLILAAELPRLVYAALTRPGVLLGLVDLLRAVPQARRKRRVIQARKTAGDGELRRWFLIPRDRRAEGRGP
jgi:GT2 family glycosyltransferase